jgi:hypothetical protein
MDTMPHARRRKPILCADFGAFFGQIGSILSLDSLYFIATREGLVIAFSACRGSARAANRMPTRTFAALFFSRSKSELEQLPNRIATRDSREPKARQ